LVRRPTILELRPRAFRIVDTVFLPAGQDVRPVGLAMLLIALMALFFLDLDLAHDPLVPSALAGLVVIGVLIVIKAPLFRHRLPLLELDLSRGVFAMAGSSHNGSGETTNEHEITEVDELLFALREVPIDAGRPRSIKIDVWATYIRLLDGEVLPVIEASLDHDRTFRVATFLADAFDVGIKQVGKGWKDP
jgi:hypothetical protein